MTAAQESTTGTVTASVTVAVLTFRRPDDLDEALPRLVAQVRDVAVAAQQGEPGILDRIGNFYAEHPDLVKTLGAGALMIALARFKNNMGR